MASTEEILAELDSLIATPTSAPAGISTVPSSSGLNLLGQLDTAYAQRPTAIKPQEPFLLYEALVPSKTAAIENIKGLGSILGAGADYAKYGLSYLSPIESLGSGYRTEVDKQAELAKQKAAKEDEDRRVQLGLSPDQYAELKKQETNKGLRHIGGQLVGGLGGAGAGAATGAAIGSIVPLIGTAIGAGLGGLTGAYLGAGTGELGVQAAEEAAGWSKPTTALEKARAFSEAGTSGLIGEALPLALKTGYKGTRAAGQAGRAWLGPKTAEEALGTIQPAIEKATKAPVGTLRSKIGQAAAREQTSGMKTTGEILNTPEALQVEQAIGMHPTNQAAYNARIASNVEESQKFLTEDLTKNLTDEIAAAPKKLNAQGKPHPEVAKTYLRQDVVGIEDIGKQMDDAFEDAATQSSQELRPLYKQIKHVDTKLQNVKAPINKALENYYPKVESKTLESGIRTTKFSGIPGKLESLVDDIIGTTRASTDDLNKWQSQLRSMAKSFARAGDDTAAKAANDVRTELIQKIESTTAGQKWTGARAAAKKRADIIENHELGKAITKEDLNPEKIFKAVTRDSTNAKNFIAAVGADHPVIRATKAYAIKAIEKIESPAAKAQWIKSNTPWLKQFFNPSEFKSLEEIVSVGGRAAEKGRKLLPIGGPATATRLAAAQSGLGRILGRGTETTTEAGKSAAKANERIKQALMIGGGLTAGTALSNMFGGNQTTAASAASILAGALIGKKLGVRRGAGTDLLRQAAYDIMMNPKTAAYTAPQLAKALATKKAAQLAGAAKAGAITGRAAQAAMYAGKLTPQEKQEQKSSITVKEESARSKAGNVLKNLDQLLGNAPAPQAKLPTPKVREIKRVATSEADAYLATKPPLIQAMALAESGSKKDKAVSPKGAIGRMQLMPDTASFLSVKDINNPIENIDAGERYVNTHIKKYGDERIALAAYNWGPGRIENLKKQLAKSGKDLTWSNIKDRIPTETQIYINNVAKFKRNFTRA